MPARAARTPRLRLDQLMVDRGLAESLTRAQALIMAGQVNVTGVERPKAGMSLSADSLVSLKEVMPWVSRGGLKLDAGLAAFGLAHVLRGTWLDSGASTGGFTQVLLTHGAERVYAVDVGYGLIDTRLREDPRVVVREKLNLRYMTRSDVPQDLDGATLDLSFISSRAVLPVLVGWLKPGAPVILLFKPQFEGEPKDVAKGGVVRDENVRARILADWESWAGLNAWSVKDRLESPIRGQAGNVEYLLKIEPHHA